MEDVFLCLDVGGTQIKGAAFGGRLRDALEPFLEAFRPEALCLGGQIMGSAALFLAPVEELCMAAGIRVCITADTSLRTLQGLTRIYAA